MIERELKQAAQEYLATQPKEPEAVEKLLEQLKSPGDRAADRAESKSKTS